MLIGTEALLHGWCACQWLWNRFLKREAGLPQATPKQTESRDSDNCYLLLHHSHLKIWKQSQCLSSYQQNREKQYIGTPEYHSALEGREILVRATAHKHRGTCAIWLHLFDVSGQAESERRRGRRTWKERRKDEESGDSDASLLSEEKSRRRKPSWHLCARCHWAVCTYRWLKGEAKNGNGTEEGTA